MAKGYFEDIFGPSSAVDISIRDGKFGWNSPLWDSMKVQRIKDTITDTFILLAYRVCKNNGDYNPPILTEPNTERIVTPLGLQVSNIIKNADLVNCRIAQYSINANKVGGERANNRLSLAVYAHFNEPFKASEIYSKIQREIDTYIVKPIRNLLVNKGAQIYKSYGYNDDHLICSYAEVDELLMFGAGSSFMKGYF